MKKKELIQRIKDKAGLTFGDRTVAIELTNVFNSFVGQLFAGNPNQYEYYSIRITLPVSNRTAQLDIPLIQTKLNGNGVPRIQTTGASDTCFPDDMVFYPAPVFGLSSSVDAAKISGYVFYKVTANAIEFSRSLPSGVTEVLATVVPEISYYDDEDFINLPAGAAEQIIDMTVAALSGQPVAGNIYKKQ